MFTGIVKNLCEVIALEKTSEILKYTIAMPIDGLEIGASVAIDGCCQTVVSLGDNAATFQAIEETLKRTTLDQLAIGTKVNIERSARIGDEIGGHLLSGHIIGTTPLIDITNNVYTFEAHPRWQKYLFEKGYIAIDGASLTLVGVAKEHFTVHLIPETLSRTTLGFKEVGQLANIEIDAQTQALVDTAERILLECKKRGD